MNLFISSYYSATHGTRLNVSVQNSSEEQISTIKHFVFEKICSSSKLFLHYVFLEADKRRPLNVTKLCTPQMTC